MTSFVTDAVDHKGLPADNSRTGGWVSAALILGIEICERFTTMAIAVNFVTYLVGTMHLPSATSAKMVTDFAGTSFLICLLGGLLADSFLGRYWTIASFAVINALGSTILAISTRLPGLRPPPCNVTPTYKCQQANGLQMGVLYISLYLNALGIGGLKSSVSGFGADQFDAKDEKEKAQMAFFFNRFYFLISIGTLLAVTVLVYIQDNVGRSWAYGICSVSMFISILVFLSGTRMYRYKKCIGSPIVQILKVMVAALRKRKLKFPSNINSLYEDSTEASRIYYTDQFHFLGKAAIMAESDNEKNGSLIPNPWKLCSVTRVEEVKMMIRLLPIWATTIIFWTIHAQIITFSVEQASTMERTIGNFQIPAGSFTVFFIGAIMITLAINDRLIMPFWLKWKGKHGFTNLQKVAIGLIFSIVGMVAAALVEMKRLSVARTNSGTVSPLPVSAFLLVPQFLLVGTGEAFMYTGQLDFFITQSPKGMKSISTGLFLTTIALGFFVSSFLVTIIKKVTGSKNGHAWLASNINNGRLDHFYGLLVLLCFIDLGFYLLCAAWYKPHEHENTLQMESVVNGSAEER